MFSEGVAEPRCRNARASYHYPDGRTTILPTVGLMIPAIEVTVARWFANRQVLCRPNCRDHYDVGPRHPAIDIMFFHGLEALRGILLPQWASMGSHMGTPMANKFIILFCPASFLPVEPEPNPCTLLPDVPK